MARISLHTGPDKSALGDMADVCIAILRAALHPQRPPDGDTLAKIDMHRLLDFANRHRVGAALAEGLRAVAGSAPYAAGNLMLAETIETHNRAANGRHRAALARLDEILAHARIENAALKGAAFLLDQADSARWRSLSDIDLLVSQECIHEAAAALMRAGYRPTMPVEGYRIADHQHFPPLASPGNTHIVELHTRLIWKSSMNPIATGEILKRARKIPGCGTLVPAAEHRIAHLIAHAQLADMRMSSATLQLKDVLDFAHLAGRSAIDWKAVDAAFSRIDRRPAMTGFIHACRVLLGPALAHVPLETGGGANWAARAIANLHNGTSNRSRLAVRIFADYARRVLTRPDGPALVVATLLDRQRRSNLLTTQVQKWRG